MNCLTVLLGMFLNLRRVDEPCTSENADVSEGFCSIETTFSLKSDLWCDNEKHLVIGDKRMDVRALMIDVENKEGCYDNIFNCNLGTCNRLKHSSSGYIVRKYMGKIVSSLLKSKEDKKFLWKFKYFYFDKEKGKVQECVVYKMPIKISENSLGFRSDVKEVRLKYIKEKSEIFITNNLEDFIEFVKKLSENELKEVLSKLEKEAEFELHHFRNYFECFENLKDFIGDFEYFKFNENEDFYLSHVEKYAKLPDFKTCFIDKLKEYFEKVYKFEITDENWKWSVFSNNYCDLLRKKILKNNILFALNTIYDINYYFEQFSKLFYEASKKIGFDFVFNAYNKEVINLILNKKSFEFDLKNLQLMTMQNICETEFVPNHFSKLVGREVKTLEDYMEVEKMICDYHNMFGYFYHKSNDKACDSFNYCSPILIDDYNMEVVGAIEIKFHLPEEFKEIKGFNDKGEMIILEKGTDYFIDVNFFYCPSDVLEKKFIKEIEIVSTIKKNSKRFNVNKYLN